jgi:hypothetical protein
MFDPLTVANKCSEGDNANWIKLLECGCKPSHEMLLVLMLELKIFAIFFDTLLMTCLKIHLLRQMIFLVLT